MTAEPANPLTEQFLTKNRTKAEAMRRWRVLKDFLDFWFFNQPEGTTLASAKQQFESDYPKTNGRAHLESDLEFMNGLGEQFLSQFSSTNFKTKLAEIETAVKNAPGVIMYVAIEMPEPELAKIGAYFKGHFGNQMLVDIQFDPQLIGGCALSYKGVYGDFSLRHKIEEQRKVVLDTLLSYKK